MPELKTQTISWLSSHRSVVCQSLKLRPSAGSPHTGLSYARAYNSDHQLALLTQVCSMPELTTQTISWLSSHRSVECQSLQLRPSAGSPHTAAVFRIRIHRINMFLGLPDPDPLVRGMDPDPDPSIIMQK
jgi:hypothetical protein